MCNESFFISKFLVVYSFFKELYCRSIFCNFYSKLCAIFSKGFNNSSIMNFLKSNWDFYLNPRESVFIGVWKGLCNNIGRTIKNGEGGLALYIQESCVISLLNERFIVLLIYILFFSIPFLPTMILAFISMIAIAVYCLNILVGKIKVKNPSIIGVVIVLFGASYFYSTFTSYNFPKSLQVMIIFLSFMIMFFLVTSCINNERRLNILINIFIISGTLVALYGIYQYTTGVEMNAAWVDSESFENIKTRAYATFGNPNVLGEYLIVVTSVACGMIWKSKGALSKCIYIIMASVLALGLVVTNSRGAMLGLLLAAGFFVLLAEKRLIIVGIIILLAMPFFLPPDLWARLASSLTFSDSSSLYRVSIYEASINILKNYWVSGIGVDAFNSIYPLFSFEAAYAYHSHNLFLQEFIELGVIGFTLFISTIILFFQRLYYGIRHTNIRHKVLIASIFGGFAGILLQGMVDHLWFDYRIILLFWGIIGLGIAVVKIGVKASNE